MKHTFTDNLIMIAELDVKPEKFAEFLDYTVENLQLSRSYPGNIKFDILVSKADPHKVVFYEIWESSKAQQEYMAWRVQEGDLTKLLSLLTGQPKFTPLRGVAA